MKTQATNPLSALWAVSYTHLDVYKRQVLLKNTVTQMVYKHAISTIVPARAVNIPHGDEASE